jgi:hypothetical protein
MPISNGYDTQAIMGALQGRIKWRSANPSNIQPVNSKSETSRSNEYFTVGKTGNLTVGGTVYTDSSLTGWTYVVSDNVGNPISVSFQASGFTLLSGTFVLGTEYVLTFTPMQKIPKAGSSGRYFEQFHPLCNLANLGSVIEMDLTVGNLGDTPQAGFLQDLEQGMIMSLMNSVFNEPQVLQDTMLFDRKLRQDNAWTNNGKFCGYRLYISPGEFAAAIKKASFIFNGAATFNLYLYQDMQTAPLAIQQVTTVANQEVYVDLTDWIIKYNNGDYAQNGVYYIGYYQDDLGSVQALDQFVSCWNKTYAFGYTAFETPKTGPGTFNRIAIPYSFTTYGMNLVVESYRDFTHRIIKNASIFDEAMGLSMAVIALGYQAFNVRTNINQRQTQDMATILYGEINSAGPTDGNPYIAGLKMQLKRELKRIHDNFFKAPGVTTSRPPIFEERSLQGVFP